MQAMLRLRLRRQELTRNAQGGAEWRVVETEETVPAAKTALIICDMWDAHWSRGATRRVGEMVGRMNEVVKAARAKGALIVHAPSGTLDFYADHPARKRTVAVPRVTPPADLPHVNPPMPVDDSDRGIGHGREGMTLQGVDAAARGPGYSAIATRCPMTERRCTACFSSRASNVC